MTTYTQHARDEPSGLAPRGTVVVLPGRGEQPALYARFARRLACDAYRVRVVGDATVDLERVTSQVKTLATEPGRTPPLVLAGLPSAGRAAVDRADEVEWRASCTTHQALLRGGESLRPGALTPERILAALREPVDPGRVALPVLGLHGDDDFISPWESVADTYRTLPAAQVSFVEDGRYDAFNAAHHRSVAATVVLFLERLRAERTAVTDAEVQP